MENEMKIAYEPDEMTAMTYQNHRLAPAPVMEPTTAKYLLDFIYFTRDDEQFRFYKKVSENTAVGNEDVTGPRDQPHSEWSKVHELHRNVLFLLVAFALRNMKIDEFHHDHRNVPNL